MNRQVTFGSRYRQRGMALVIVLWLVALMSVIATGHSRNAHTEVRLATRQLESAKARATAQAAYSLTVLELLSSTSLENRPNFGTPYDMRLNDRDILITVRPIAALLDINSASEMLLRSLFVSAGTDEATASSIAAAVVDWRDSDDLTHLNGAEDGHYYSAGLAWSARDDRFVSIDELRYVLGMTPTLFRKVAPSLTVHSDGANIDLASAPSILIQAISGSDFVTQIDTSNTSGPGTYKISISVAGQDSVNVAIEVVVQLSGSSEGPATILDWRDASRVFIETGDDGRI